MTIAEKLATIEELFRECMILQRTLGSQEEYDRFWDSYQPYGAYSAGTWYNYSFAGTSWKADAFRPKYDLIANGASYMFAGNRIPNLKETLNELGRRLDTTPATQANYMFSDCYTSELGELNMTNCTALTGLFYGATKLVTIDKLILKSDGTNTFSNTFYNAKALQNITIEGVIGKNGFDVHWCPLTYESLMSIVSALQDKTNDKSTVWKITLGSDNLATLGDEGTQMIIDKGWEYA